MNIQILETQPTKTNIAIFAKQIAQEVIDGNSEPIKMAVKLEALSQSCKAAKAIIEKDVLDAIAKNGKDNATLGATVAAMEGGVKYDYSNTKEWVALQEQIDDLLDYRKTLEENLRSLKEKIVIVDEETGEAFERFPPIKTSKSTYSITLGK